MALFRLPPRRAFFHPWQEDELDEQVLAKRAICVHVPENINDTVSLLKWAADKHGATALLATFGETTEWALLTDTFPRMDLPPDFSAHFRTSSAQADIGKKDVTFGLRDEMAVPARPLPQYQQLKQFVSQPPQVLFPVPADLFVRLPSQNRDQIFRLAKLGENCLEIIRYVYFLIEPPMAGGSESNFHQLYDTLISDALAFFFVSESWVRNRDQAGEGSSGIMRPDVVARFVSGLYALFRGEEKGPRSNGDPAQELLDKLEWTYGDLIPYILAYHAREYLVTFCSLRCVDGANLRDDIVTLNLARAKDRVELFILCLNFSRILTTLRDLCISESAPPDITEYQRQNGKLVQIFGKKVAKIYSKRLVFERVLVLYSEIRGCPHVEVMLHHNMDERSIVFERVFSSRPVTEKQLVECLRCICRALVWLAGRQMMHRDIRWENVAKRKEGDWVLLDFDEACRSPSAGAVRHLRAETHAPEMQLGVHTTAVDVWSVGLLLSTWTTPITLPRHLEMLKNRCLEAAPKRRPTACDCLSVLESNV